MKKQDYQHLVGRSKNEIMEEMGDEFNFPPLDLWTYLLKRTWYGEKKVLVIVFENNRAVKVTIKRMYGEYKAREL